MRQDIDDIRADLARVAETLTHDPALRIYGFMDVGLQKTFLGNTSLVQNILPTEAATFVLGNINLYFDAHPSDDWSAFLEVRLTNLPDGEDTAGSAAAAYKRTSTAIYDLTSASGGFSTIHLGGLVLERAYMQWRQSDKLTLRVGELLTPYGIWNVDHGTPTLISLMLPSFVEREMFPAHQLGVEAFGTYHLVPWELEYNFYISNGRTPSQFDYTDDKAFGGRFVLRRSSPHRLAFGTSFYVGQYADQTRSTVTGAPVEIQRTETVGYLEIGLGADVSIDLGPLRLRSELTVHRVTYKNDERESMFGIPGVFWANRVESDWYGLAAYQLPWLGLEPYAYFEYLNYPTVFGEAVLTPSVGLNIHFSPAVQLKLQVSRQMSQSSGGTDSSANDVTLAAARAVIAF